MAGKAGANVVSGAMGQQQAPPAEWSTRMTQNDGAVKCEDWLFACFCTQCAASMAKSKTDRSHPCYNFLCWTPIGGYSYVRLAYGIRGTCGDDMGWGIFCPCCVTRHMYSESSIRGGLNGAYGANSGTWNYSLFDCTPCECCEVAFCLPCTTNQVRMHLPSQGKSEESCCFDALCVMPTAMYGQVRNDYGILSDFGPLEDVLLPLVCFPCAMIRAKKEAQHQRTSGGAAGAAGTMAQGLMNRGKYGSM